MHDKHSVKKIKKRKNRRGLKVISIVLAPTILISAGVICKRKDDKINHLYEACPFSKICTELNLSIGYQHLIKEIEANSAYTAYYQKERVNTYYIHSRDWFLKDGLYFEEEKLIPEGYQLLDKPHHGYDCYKEEYEPEAVVVLDKNKKLVRKLLLK